MSNTKLHPVREASGGVVLTERYMGRPQDDPHAYDESSVLNAAKNLHGALLISHGTSDNNVHMANSIALLQQFVLADKENVDFMVYPRTLHPIAGLAQHRQLFGHMLRWWVEHLLQGSRPPAQQGSTP